jgi:hypothetical protein
VSTQDGIKRFAKRPSNPDAWVRKPGADRAASQMPNEYTARLTVDVTPELRGRIKIAAFRRGLTAADMLRTLLERVFPSSADDAGSAP